MCFYQGSPDVIIRGGCVVDGSGGLPYYADLAIEGERIAYIGNLKGVSAPTEIDARHKYVTNGFIDSHSHADQTIWSCPEAYNVAAQGVTTEIVGNCGMSMRTSVKPEEFDPAGDGIDCAYNLPGPEYPAGCMAASLDRAEKQGCGVNTAWLCGHNDIRMMVGCMQKTPTPEQLERMKGWVRECMDAGYIGFSTGLEFVPGSVSEPWEVEELAAVAAEYDANYTTHMRDEGTYLLEAVNEFLNVIRKTGMRGTVSHLNVKYDNGIPNEYLQRAMDMLKTAREVEHLNVYCDMLPTTFATGGAMAMLPSWLYADGWEEARRTLADPAGREKVKGDLCRYWRFLAYGQWDRLLYILPPWDKEVCVTPFGELCRQRGREPADVFLDVMQSAPTIEAANACNIQGTVFFEQQLIDSVIRDPIYMWQMDVGFGREGGNNKAERNVQTFMSMSHFIIRYVRELGVISLADACKKLGTVPAEHYRLVDRGTLRVGNYADVNVFDLNALKINATFTEPAAYSTGMDWVLVNGTPIVADGKLTGARPGKVLRHLPTR